MTAASIGYSMKMAMVLKSRFTTASLAAYSVITRSAHSTSTATLPRTSDTGGQPRLSAAWAGQAATRPGP